MSELPEYVLDRIFEAPRELVWRAWTDPEILHRWYGPIIETIIHKFDLKPGGSWLNEMKWGGNSDFSKIENGGDKLVHGSGGISQRGRSKTLPPVAFDLF